MKKIKVAIAERSKKYDVNIGTNIIRKLGVHLKGLSLGGNLLVVTNPKVFKLYGQTVVALLKKEGFSVSVSQIPDGERYKSLRFAKQVYDELLDKKFERKSTVLALGGGVIGDLAGFSAATFMRGINFVQVPTTLLAQVDASVGGKVGVNLPEGKNMVGAFYQPELVYIDTAVLKTLAQRELKAGMAEVVKYGVIRDGKFFNYLEDNVEDIMKLKSSKLEYVISRSCKIKAGVVEEDEKETRGVREILNFGHTLGHAIEVFTKYRVYRHGEAISIGMILASMISCQMGLTSRKCVDRQKDLLSRIGLPTLVRGINANDLIKLLERDKKILHGQMRFVLPKKIGSVFLTDKVNEKIIRTVLKQLS